MKLTPAATAGGGGGQDDDAPPERNRTKAEMEAMAEPLNILMTRMARLVELHGYSPLIEILVGALLRLGMHPSRVWELIKSRMPDECARIELEQAKPVNTLPL